jgi:tetratricopeptide (TPR) repeat protein
MSGKFLGYAFTLVLLVRSMLITASPAMQEPVDSLRVALSKSGTDSARIDLSMQLSQAYQSVDNNLALEYAQQAVVLSEKSGSSRQHFEALRHAGSLLFFIGLTDVAADYFSRHLTLAEKLGNKLELGYGYFNIGAFRLFLGDYERSTKLFEKSKKIWESYHQEMGTPVPASFYSSYHNNIGSYHMAKGRLSDAEVNFIKAIAYGREDMENPFRLSQALTNYASLLLKRKDIASALKVLNENIILSKRKNDIQSECTAMRFVGAAYEQRGEFDLALQTYHSAYDIAIRNDVLATKLLLSESIYELHKRIGKADSALFYIDIHKNYLRQTKVEEARDYLTRQELLSEFREREKALEKNNMLGSRVYILIITLGIVLSIGLALYAFRTSKHYRSNVLVKTGLEQKAEKMRIEQELLRTEIDQKDKQIATQINQVIEQNDKIDHMVHDLQADRITHENSELVGKLINQLEHFDKDNMWAEFEIRFLQVHTAFYDRLMNRHPDLTVNERRLCAFLRLDMTTKEISRLTGQSVRAIGLARIRLRRKLNLTHTETDLFQHLSSI